jgi:hypothetical protein
MRLRSLIVSLMLLSLMLLWHATLPALAAEDPYSPILPSEREAVVERTQGKLSSYVFSLTLDPDAHTISGTEKIAYLNLTDRPQSTIEFRLFPNADYYGDGGIEVARVLVDGARVIPALSAQSTIMSIPLEESVKPGERRALHIDFTTTVPVDSAGSFGIFSIDEARGTWILADWYPILAGWEPDEGLVLDPPTDLGDPTFSDTAFYEMALTMPAAWSVAATGDERRGKERDGMTTWRVVTGPVRELAMVIDDDFAVTSREVDGVTVTFFGDGSGATAAGGEIALDEAATVLGVYSELFGAYPYDELDLVETEMFAALGVSWTGLVFLNGDKLLASSFFVNDEPDRLRFTVAHEIGHQWWGALVGLNSNDHTFLLEGLTNYLAVVALERTAGAEAAEAQLLAQSVNPYLRALESDGDGVADIPIDVETTGASRGTLVYGKAALGFLAIRRQIGDEAFFSAIRAWADAGRFEIASPEGLLAAFEQESSADVAATWRFWFQEANATAADVEALLT